MTQTSDHSPIDFEAEYDDAFNRIIAKLPRDPSLKAKLLDGKNVYPNPTNVALEAGRSRSKLYECIGIMTRIADHRKDITPAKAEVAKLSAEKADLVQQNIQLLSAMAAMILRVQKMEAVAKKETDKKARQDRRSEGNTVVPFRNPKDDAP